jgi:hypothetical protein
MRELVGGVTATELRTVALSDAAFQALVDGLKDPNPRIRWVVYPVARSRA